MCEKVHDGLYAKSRIVLENFSKVQAGSREGYDDEYPKKYLGVSVKLLSCAILLCAKCIPFRLNCVLRVQVEGAIIVRVLPDTPAADAGLRRHDVVIEMGGRAVRTADEAKQVVDESSVGDVLSLKVGDFRGTRFRGCRQGFCDIYTPV